jgi:hypothetical protein
VGGRLQQIGGYLYDQAGRLVGAANQAGRGVSVPPGGIYGGTVSPAQGSPGELITSPGATSSTGIATPMGNQARTPALVQVPPPPAPAPPSAAGVQGAPGTPSGPAQTPAQRNPPVLPWPAPAATPAAPAPTPTSAAPPQATGGGILTALNPANWISSAQAAEPAPAAAPVATSALTSPTPPAPAATEVSAGKTAATQPVPDTTKAASAKTGTVVAQSATQPAPSPTPAATRVPPVAPDQVGPTTTSELPAKIATAPPVNPEPWRIIQERAPNVAQAIINAQREFCSDGACTVEQLAAHKIRESGIADHSAAGDGGESLGVAQVQKGTWASMFPTVPPTGKFDPLTLQGSINQMAMVLRHLARDSGLGDNTIQTNAAYMRGAGWVHDIVHYGQNGLNENPQAVGFLIRSANGWPPMYAGIKDLTPQHFPGAFGNYQHTTQMLDQTVQAAQLGPDAVLRTLASFTPRGMGMSQSWQIAQAYLEMGAIARGQPGMVPVIQQFIAQQSHAGAIGHMYAADQALLNGDRALAAQHLVQAYAFFPDGASGAIGQDQKTGELWLQRYSERTNEPLGPPVHIDHELLAQNMIMLQNPQNYPAELLKRRQEVAAIEETQAKSFYYRAMPGVKEDIANIQTQSREQIADLRIEAQRALEQQREEARRSDAALKAQLAEAKDDQRRDTDKQIATEYAPDSARVAELRQQNLDPAAVGSIDNVLRYPPHMGGGGMSPPAAADLARRTVDPKGGITVKPSTDGKTLGFFHPGEKDPFMAIDRDLGDRFVTPFVTIRPPQGAPPSQGGGRVQQGALGPVGSGANSPMLAMQGGMNLAGVPALQPPQQQQAAA